MRAGASLASRPSKRQAPRQICKRIWWAAQRCEPRAARLCSGPVILDPLALQLVHFDVLRDIYEVVPLVDFSTGRLVAIHKLCNASRSLPWLGQADKLLDRLDAGGGRGDCNMDTWLRGVSCKVRGSDDESIRRALPERANWDRLAMPCWALGTNRLLSRH